MQIRFLCSLLLSFCFTLSFGQHVIDGVVKSTDKKPLAGISILLYDKGGSNIIAYNFSDENGTFKLAFNQPDDYLLIATKSIAYKDTSRLVANKNQYLEFILTEQYNEIPEVNVKGYPISARGDTIIYTVKSFAQEKDLSIGDVIQRLPGFEVNTDGQVSYQGQPIQKYYIEGLDLLEQRYNIANRNLPHQAVSSVEVLQNHQPVKMLQDKIASNGTSLNIRLDKKIAVTGTMYAGVGLSPFLQDINLTPMLFTKKQQLVTTVQYNNIGTDLNKQHLPLEFKMDDLQGFTNSKEELLGISSVAPTEIENYRFLDNHAFLFSHNQLLKLKNDMELKINSSYYNDRILEKAQMRTSYFLGNETLIIDEFTDNTFYNNSLSTEFSLLQNTKKRYLQNKATINAFWDEQKGIVQSTEIQEQVAKTPHLSLTNEFDTYFPIKRNFIRIYSFIDYNNSPQKMIYSPAIFENILNRGVNYQETCQNYTKNSLVTQHFFQLALKKGNWILENEPGIKFGKQHLGTFIELDKLKLDKDSFRNQLDWDYYEFYLNERIKYETNRFNFNLELPLNEIVLSVKDACHQSPSEQQSLLFTPSVFLKQDIGNFWSVKCSFAYTKSLGQPDNLTQGYVINSYRQIDKKADKIAEKEGYQYAFGLKYKNPISGLFYDLLWYSTYSQKNLLMQYEINNEGLGYFNALELENIVQSDNLSVSLGKFLSKIKSTVKLTGNYNKRLTDYFSDDEQKTNEMRLFFIKPSVSISKWRFLDIEYSYQYQIVKQNLPDTSIAFVDQTHKGSFYVHFSKSHQLGMVCEYYQSASEQQNESETFFSDLSYFYKPQKSKFRFRIKCNNFFNQTAFVKYYNSEISLTRSSTQTRPRQLMLTVFYNL